MAAIGAANRAIELDAPIEPAKGHLDSVLYWLAPLSRLESLARYDFYHWYYTTYRHGDYECANLLADSALALFKEESFKNENLEAFGKWMLFKGDALVHKKQLYEAFNYYYRVKSDYLNRWDDCKLSQFTARLGFVRYKQTNYRDAINYYLQAYQQFGRCVIAKSPTSFYEAVTEPQGLLNNIGWLYDLLELPDSASYYYHRALEFIERESVRFPGYEKATDIAKGVIYGNLGGMYTKLGKYGEALRYLKESVAINTRPAHDHRDVQTAQIKLANLYIELGRFKDAERILADCRKGLDTLSSEDFELRWKQVHWRFLDQQGRLADAYKALHAYHNFKDSV